MINVNEFKRFSKFVPGATYVILVPGGKSPIARGGKRVYVDEAAAHAALEAGNNVGILAREGYCIIDVDDPDVLPDGLFTPTLAMRSRKRRGVHHLYEYTDARINSLKSIPQICDIQIADRKAYVVAPGSFVECDQTLIDVMPASERNNAGKYTVAKGMLPATLEYKDVPAYIKWYAYTAAQPTQEHKTHVTETSGRNPIYDLAVRDVVRVKRVGHFANPWHGSTGGANSKMVGDKLMCYRCGVSHTGFTALMVSAKVATCANAGYGFNGGQSSVDRYGGEALFKMWSYALRNGIMSMDTPPPARAVAWYALQTKMVEALVEGWKVPEDQYGDVVNNMRLEL